MKRALSTPYNVTFGLNIFLHSLILFTFLTIFFIVFVTKLMKEAFDRELTSLIEKNLGKAIDNLDDKTKRNLSMYMKLLPVDRFINMYKEPSEYVIAHNNWVKMLAIGLAVIGVIMLVLVVWLLNYSCNQRVPVWHILKENVIVFAFVGVVEYLFFTNIAIKFIPAPPSLLVKTLIDKFKDSLIKNTY